jgi:hypothetical protein
MASAHIEATIFSHAHPILNILLFSIRNNLA